ncbi:unnamed protein product [marine sediment metagenome]|uniref:Uncharacterized protein n=1 Tax=marine sediment metagenome TaxID=412755 RepID=X1MDI1_9ZZZZ
MGQIMDQNKTDIEVYEKHFRVAIFGSARIREYDPIYQEIYKLAHMIALENKVKMMTKTKKKRISFLTDEAVDSYLEWKKIRDDYLKVAVTKSKGYKISSNTW